MRIEVARCTFTANSGTSGGAVYVSANASGFLESCTFADNTASSPGELDAPGGSDAGDGGALHLVAVDQEPRLRLRHLAFGGNAAYRGGGIFQAYSAPSPRFFTCSDCSDLLGNAAAYGAYQATAAVQLRIHTANRTRPRGGLLVTSGEPMPVFALDLLDFFGNKVTTGTTDLAEIFSEQLVGSLRVAVANGTFRWRGILALSTGLNTSARGGATFHTLVKVTSPGGSFPGAITHSTRMRFCPGGAYQRVQTCVRCPAGFYCEASQPRRACPANTFSFSGGAGIARECVTCGVGLACGEAYLNVTPGYWVNIRSLANASRPEGYECNLQGCKGASYTLAVPEVDDGRQCSRGYSNCRLCARCSRNYYQLLGKCHHCSPSYSHLWYPLAALVVAAWVALNRVSDLFDSVNFVLVEMQFLTVIGNFGLSWPLGWTATIMQTYQVCLFNLDLLGPDCVHGSYTYNYHWLVSVLVPLAGIAIYAALFVLHELRAALRSHLPARWRGVPAAVAERSRASRLRRLVSGAGNFLDIVYMDTAIRCFEVFRAATYDARVLGADPSVLWKAQTHTRLVPFAFLYLVTYVIGFPLFLGTALIVGRRKGLLGTESFREAFGWLYERNKRQWWFNYLPFTVVRRLIFAAILVFFSATPDLQAVLALVLLGALLSGHLATQPLRMSSLNALAGLLLLAQLSFTLGGVAGTFMTGAVSGSVAASLCGAGVVAYILGFLAVVPYEVHGQWVRRRVRRWAEAHGQPEGQARQGRLGKTAAAPFLPAQLPRKRRDAGVDRAASPPGRGRVDSRLVPLPEITVWFAPRAMRVFVRDAREEELACLHSVRYHFSYHRPSDADVELTRAVLEVLPKEMRYAAVSQLLAVDPSSTIYAERVPGMLHQNGGGGVQSDREDFDNAVAVDPGEGSETLDRNGGGGDGSMRKGSAEFDMAVPVGPDDRSKPLDRNGGGSVKDGSAEVDVVTARMDADAGQRRLALLRAVAEQMAKERSREGDSLRVLLDGGQLHVAAAWLIFGSVECRRAFADLALAMRRHVCSLLHVPNSLHDECEAGQHSDNRSRYDRLRAKVRLFMLRHFT